MAALPTSHAGLVELVASTPTVPKVLAGITLVLYFWGLVVPSTESVLALKATNTYGAHSYFWNIFTAGFFNKYFVLAFGTSACFIVIGRFLGSHWGPGEFVRYICFTNLCVGLSLFLWQIFKYMASFNYHHLEEPVAGGAGLVLALVVTIKQLMPEEQIKMFGNPVGGYTAKDLPGLLICVSAVLSLTRILPVFGQSLMGAYFGWLYLRFVQKSQDGLRGDPNENMAFIAFFPVILRPLAQIVSSFAHKLVCVKAMQTMLDDLPIGTSAIGSTSGAGLTLANASIGGVAPAIAVPKIPAPPLPGTDRADAERRRARALKALEERLRSISTDGDEGNAFIMEGLAKAKDGAQGESITIPIKPMEGAGDRSEDSAPTQA